jgi:hypothetical protein
MDRITRPEQVSVLSNTNWGSGKIWVFDEFFNRRGNCKIRRKRGVFSGANCLKDILSRKFTSFAPILQ